MDAAANKQAASLDVSILASMIEERVCVRFRRFKRRACYQER